MSIDYSKMSDFEINKLVGKATKQATAVEPCFEVVIRNANGQEFNPCKNPADSWPIIADRKICLAFDVFAEPQDGGAWVASPAYGYEVERVRHDNPLRAAMVVYLMIQEAK